MSHTTTEESNNTTKEIVMNSKSLAFLKRNHKLFGVLVAAVVAMGTLSTTASSGATPTQLVIADNEPPQTFDPQQAGNSTVNEVVIPLYDVLVDFDSQSKLGPRLAKSWAVSANGKTITIALRKDVKFHDGTGLTSADVKYTLDRIKKINTGVASELAAYSSTTIVDAFNLKLNLSSASAPFLSALSRAYILNSKLVELNAGDDSGQTWLANNEAGSGPYTLKSYTTNQEANFSKFASYWRGFTKQADNIVIRYIPQSATQRDLLKSGEINLAVDIATADLPSFGKDTKYVVDQRDTMVQLYIFFNTQKGVTKNPKVREAIRLAYDYQSHVKNILAGAGAIAQGPLPTVMNCHAPIKPGKQDLVRAKALLKEAGVSNLKIKMSYLSVIEEMARAGTLLQSALKTIGVNLELQTVTFPEYMSQVSKVATTPDLGMIYAFPSYPDPNAVLSINFDSKNIGGGYNYASYSNPAVDKLVRAAAIESNPAKRCALYVSAQKAIEADFVAINISNPKFVSVHDKKVSGNYYRPAHHNTIDFYSIMMK